jgi:hypothetical protein
VKPLLEQTRLSSLDVVASSNTNKVLINNVVLFSLFSHLFMFLHFYKHFFFFLKKKRKLLFINNKPPTATKRLHPNIRHHSTRHRVLRFDLSCLLQHVDNVSMLLHLISLSKNGVVAVTFSTGQTTHKTQFCNKTAKPTHKRKSISFSEHTYTKHQSQCICHLCIFSFTTVRDQFQLFLFFSSSLTAEPIC